MPGCTQACPDSCSQSVTHKRLGLYRRDILLATALASCGLASAALAREHVRPVVKEDLQSFN